MGASRPKPFTHSLTWRIQLHLNSIDPCKCVRGPPPSRRDVNNNMHLEPRLGTHMSCRKTSTGLTYSATASSMELTRAVGFQKT